MTRKPFVAWLDKYYVAEQDALTVEALWAAWQEGARDSDKENRRLRSALKTYAEAFETLQRVAGHIPEVYALRATEVKRSAGRKDRTKAK